MAVLSSHKDNGAVVALLAPVVAQLPSGMTVTVDTMYPFEDTATITCTVPSGSSDTPIYIRVPSWSGDATLNGEKVEAGTLVKRVCSSHKSNVAAGTTTSFVLKLAPDIRLEKWVSFSPPCDRCKMFFISHAHEFKKKGDLQGNASAVSVLRGALLYSLPIEAKFTQYNLHYFNTHVPTRIN